ARSGGAAALDMAENRHPGLEAGPLLELRGERGADATEPDVAELVEGGLLRDLSLLAVRVRQLVALADDDDREVLAALVPPAHLVAGLLDGDRLLGDEDHVGAAGDPAHDGDP